MAKARSAPAHSPRTSPLADTEPAPASTPAVLAGGELVGQHQTLPLSAVRQNSWNPNRMTPETLAALKHGLQTDGWLVNQALLIWGTDEHGADQNIIIDGEHRWRAAQELGFTHGPMVLLHNLPEARAKALTVAMNQKRGEFDATELEALLRSIEHEVPDLALSTGITDDELARMLSVPEVELDAPADAPPAPVAPPAWTPATAPQPGAPVKQIRQVMLFFSADQHADWEQLVTGAIARHGVTSTAEAVLAVLRADQHTSGDPEREA